MKTLGALLVIAALGFGGWTVWQKKQTAASTVAAASGRPTTATLETRSIRFSVSAAGEITPSEQVSVRPEVNGKILLLPVDVGDALKKDQLLFQLDDRDLQIEKQSQETAIDRSKLQLDQSERDYKRAQQLFDVKLLPQQDFEDIRTRYALAKNDIERVQKALDLVNDKLRKTRVTAPFDGTVLTRPVSNGQAVSGSGGFNSGTEVLTIANLNDLIINAHINQADVTRLRVEQEVEVSIEAVPGLKITGKVERLAPQAMIKNNIKGFAARILLKNVDKRVRPGMTANISIPVASADDVVAAPLASVFTEFNPETKQQERYVWLQTGEEWERRPITIGVSDYFFAEVTTGLKSGDTVALEDKAKVAKAAPAKTAGASKTSGGSAQTGAPAARTQAATR